MICRVLTGFGGLLAAVIVSGLLAAAEPEKSVPVEPGEKSDGVIAPPRGVDPKMEVRPPPAGGQRTPGIPPPGSPGGDPDVVPK
jgi:hypothetical protein